MTQRTRIAIIGGATLILVAFVAVLVRTSPPTVALNGGSYNVPLQPGTKLSLDVNSGGVEVLAGEAPELRIDYVGDPDLAPEFRVQPGQHKIIVGVHGMKNRTKVIITVPRNTDLDATLGAGELLVKNLVGDKDLTVYAGRIGVSGDTKQYGRADAKVLAGKVSASPMHIDKGGVFRWATWNGPGKSSLNMTVLSGEVFVSD